MSHAWHGVVVLVLGLAPSGCRAAIRPDGSLAASGSTAAVIEIGLERGPCFGSCPVYDIAIRGDGSVRLDARRNMDTTGVVTLSVPAGQVRRLADHFVEAGFFDVRDAYTINRFACRPHLPDMPRIVLTARIGDRYKRVEHELGCLNAPETLAELEQKVDSLAQVQRWILGRHSPQLDR